MVELLPPQPWRVRQNYLTQSSHNSSPCDCCGSFSRPFCIETAFYQMSCKGRLREWMASKLLRVQYFPMRKVSRLNTIILQTSPQTFLPFSDINDFRLCLISSQTCHVAKLLCSQRAAEASKLSHFPIAVIFVLIFVLRQRLPWKRLSSYWTIFVSNMESTSFSSSEWNSYASLWTLHGVAFMQFRCGKMMQNGWGCDSQTALLWEGPSRCYRWDCNASGIQKTPS